MPPKKGKKKGKGKGKKKGNMIGDDVDPMERNFILQAEAESLQRKLLYTYEEARICKKRENEKREREQQLQQTMTDEKKRTNDIVADMTRQYKATQEDLMSQNSILATQIDYNEDQIGRLRKEKDLIIDERKKLEQKKDSEIKDMQR